MTALPLAGIRVVDLADEKAELAGRLLADLGAEVVRVEPPGGAASRAFGPFHEGESLHFAVRNTNKVGVRLDLDDPTGREELHRLLGDADILIDTARPGERIDELSPHGLAERHASLVVVAVTDFGLDGPYRDFVATGSVMDAMAWMLFRAGVLGRPPVLPPGSLSYDVAGITAAFAALTGYVHRRRTGDGTVVDLSVIEAVQQTTDWGLPSWSVAERLAPGAMSQIRTGGGNIYPVLACKDGWVRPAIVTVAEWRKMREWLGEPEALQDERLDELAARSEIYDDVIEPMLLEFFADMTMIEAAEEGQRRRIPITPLLRPADAMAAEHYGAVETFTTVDVTERITGTVPSGFFRVDGERVGPRTRAPEPTETFAWSRRDDPTSLDFGGDDDRGPFAGLRVLDFGIAGAGPEVARLLAEYGADVIRVESPHRPDLFRQLGGPSGISPVFASSNRSKRSLGLDFREPEAVALIESLVAGADLLVENLPPGTMDRYGIGWDDLRAVNPELVMISSQTMGSSGPWKEWRGYGANTQPPGGMTYLWSFPDAETPVASNVAFPDHVVGRLGATFAAASMIGRERRNEGLHAEIIQAEVAINLLGDLFLREDLVPGTATPIGNRSSDGAPWGVYPCAGEERWCVITCRDDRDWKLLCSTIDRPDWRDDESLANEEGRRRRHDELDRGIGEWTAQRSDHEVMETLQAAGVPAGKMMYVGDIVDDPHLRARGYPLAIDQPGVGEMVMEGPSFGAESLPGPITTPAPRLGEHTADIALGLLGLSADELNRLLAAGVLHAG